MTKVNEFEKQFITVCKELSISVKSNADDLIKILKWRFVNLDLYRETLTRGLIGYICHYYVGEDPEKSGKTLCTRAYHLPKYALANALKSIDDIRKARETLSVLED